jgi:hypothetical protein
VRDAGPDGSVWVDGDVGRGADAADDGGVAHDAAHDSEVVEDADAAHDGDADVTRVRDAVADSRPPPLQLVPAMQDFGTVTVGGLSASVDFTLTNVGSGPTPLLRADITGPDPLDFVLLTDECSGTTLVTGANCVLFVIVRDECVAGLPPISSCTIAVAFRPASMGPKAPHGPR